MQEILLSERKPLDVDSWIRLKKKFRRRIAETPSLLQEADARRVRLSPLSNAFKDSEKAFLLTAIVPNPEEVEYKPGLELAPIHHQHMVEVIAVNWGQISLPENAITRTVQV